MIHFTQIDRSSRIRTTYSGLDELAESIEQNGLIQPIVISTKGGDIHDPKALAVSGDVSAAPTSNPEGLPFTLNAGGRRCAALELLLSTNRWDGVLHHGITCKPGMAGYVLKDEPGTELSNLLTEIAENLDREDLSWQDNLKGIVKAAKLLRQQEHANGHMIVQRDLGAIIGCGYQDLRAAEAVYADLVSAPADYLNATTIRNAYAIMLGKQSRFLEKLHNDRALIVKPQALPDPVQGEPSLEEASPTIIIPSHIPLTERFHNADWQSLYPESVDHIITDPDYGVTVERLEAGVAGAATGVNQSSISESLDQMQELCQVAARILRPSGFFIFFYDLDHHEKVQAMATGAGFAVQRWPITWHKSDYRSNAAPSHNTAKNEEWAMVCRKPGATLTKPCTTSVFSCPSGQVVKDLGHPFAKPPELWKFLFSLACRPGQTIWDPCCGVGSQPLAAIDFGLNPLGNEINPDHYQRLLMNLQASYTKKLGANVTFS